MKKAKITLKTKLPDTGENVDFFHYANPAMTEKMSQEQIETDMTKMLKEVRMDTPIAISAIIPSYSFEDKVDPFPYGNTLIDVGIPYCLHIPNGSEFKINLKDKGYEALVSTQKQWTEN